jgi:hypothetical protein
MKNAIIVIVGCLVFCNLAQAQEQLRQLKGDGHELGETAEQFYSEGHAGDMLRACQAGDWKSVTQMSKDAGRSSKIHAKEICAKQVDARQQATSGARLEYEGSTDKYTMRTVKFTFDGGHLVKMDMVYKAPIANVQGYHPKSFAELFAGLQEAYGAPTKTSIESVFNAYGVRSEAHRAIWMGKENVILIIEQPGEDGWTEIVAATLAEHNREAQAPKTSNPLQ